MKNIELKGGIDVPVKSSSKQFSLNGRDFWIGLLMAIGTPILTILYDALQAWLDYQPVHIDYRFLLKTGISAGVLYLGKNYFDKGKVVIDPKKLEQAKK